MPLSSLFSTISVYALHKIFSWPLEWLHRQVLSLYLNRFSKSEISSLVNRFLDRELLPLYHAEVLKELNEAKAEGADLALCSSSPDFLVGAVASRLGILYWCGTCYQFDNQGKICEIDPVVDGFVKAEYVAKLMQKNGIEREEVTVYSDSYLDLPLFEQSGSKVAVNPDRKLKKHLNFSHWRVISS